MDNPAKTMIEGLLTLTRGTAAGEGISAANKAKIKALHDKAKANYEAGRFPALTARDVVALAALVNLDMPRARPGDLAPDKV